METMAEMARAEAAAESAMLDPMFMIRGGLSFAPEGHPIREGSDMARELMTRTEHEASATLEEPMRWGLTIGAMVSIPIAPWSKSGPERRAEAYERSAEEQLLRRDAMAREMRAMLVAAFTEIDRTRIRREYHLRTQIPLLERTVASLRAEYATGRTSFASVIDGYTMLAMAHMDLAMRDMELAMSMTMIVEIIGGVR
jgi:hypothetical protein